MIKFIPDSIIIYYQTTIIYVYVNALLHKAIWCVKYNASCSVVYVLILYQSKSHLQTLITNYHIDTINVDIVLIVFKMRFVFLYNFLWPRAIIPIYCVIL